MSLFPEKTNDFRLTDSDEGQRWQEDQQLKGPPRAWPLSLFEQCRIELSHLPDIHCLESESTVLVDRLGQVPAHSYLQLLLSGDPIEKLEALWALAIVTSGTSEQIEGVIDGNVVSILVGLLYNPSDYFRLLAVLALGNMAGDSPAYRDLVLSEGALAPLLALLNEHATVLFLRVAAVIFLNTRIPGSISVV
ncbi:OLC1v1003249C1 [Oldenlandia corymbosa var. corymbosa]|uniref:OLC1v1003249C1 n=1 Tax=Oldenlandia corymbosa var. corymbosa TaxID=529605 RepID=A0AAV1DCK8_OLDCO|nr:OLC1v1003249C1 [Oldenlandia corymbosa var. corymbosa]